MSKTRLANLDLLRIISMIFILIVHAIMYGVVGADSPAVDMSSSWAIANWAGMYWIFFLVSTGVNCYVMLSGYLLAENTSFRWKSIIKTWLTTFFYSFGICLIFVIIGKASPRELLTYSFPVYNDVYWFMSKFIGLMLIAPFLSMLVKTIDKRTFNILFVILSVMNLRLFKFPYGEVFGGGRSLFWFTYLYLVGAYVKLYHPFSSFKHFGKSWFIFGILLASAYMGVQVILYLRNGKPFDYGNTFNNSLTFVTSLLIFFWAVYHKTINSKVSSAITKIAPYIIGSYLITEHNLVRFWLWDDMLHLKDFQSSPLLLLFILIIIIALFTICTLIDMGRERCFKILHIDKAISHILNTLQDNQH